MRQSLFLASGKPQIYFFFLFTTNFLLVQTIQPFLQTAVTSAITKKKKKHNLKVNSDQQCYGNIFIYNLGADRSTQSPYPNTPADQKLGRQKTNHGSLVC